ncbi:MAG: hypothetical protein IAE84_03635 [Saprospiraceae bacterium]|nr:hypothetical protein [Saprospiraceae bacterium]
MTSFRIRPRFRVEVEMKPEEIKTHFRERLEQPGAPCVAAFFPQHVILRVPPEERHFWSPCLELSLEEEGDHTLIRGLYGPNPQVWTMFILIYGAIGVLALFITIIGVSRVMLDMSAPVLWALPVLGGAALLLYIFSQTGQKLGAEQTFTLHHFFEDTVHHRAPVY